MNPQDTTIQETDGPGVAQASEDGRRGFLSRAVVAFGALAGLGVASSMTSTALGVSPRLRYFRDIPGTGDVKILNYALSLEDLEADLYKQALMRLTNGGTNVLGRQIPGLGISASAPDVEYTREFGRIEVEHRNFIRGTLISLGGPVIPMFKYDFGMENLTRKQVVELIYTAERTGVGAYLGAIKLFPRLRYLQVAGSILGTEARHTAVIAGMLNFLFDQTIQVAPGPNVNNGIDQPINPEDVLAAISPFIVI